MIGQGEIDTLSNLHSTKNHMRHWVSLSFSQRILFQDYLDVLYGRKLLCMKIRYSPVRGRKQAVPKYC